MATIEDQIAALTAALKENTAAILASNDLRTAAIGAVKEAAAAAPAAAKKDSKKAEAADYAAAAAVSAASAAAAAGPAETKAEAAAPATNGLITEAQQAIVSQKVADYLGGADRADAEWAKLERAARKERVVKLLSHEKVLAPGKTFSVKEICMAASGFQIFESTIAKFIAEGDLTKAPESAAGGSALNL